MPWETEDAIKHNKDLSPNKQKIWASVANSVLEKCLEDGGEQKVCEAKAITQANGVVKKATLQDEVESVEFDESGNITVTFTQSETYSTDMEVFSIGKWNNDDYSTIDLDHMVEAFEALKGKWKPFLKLGHGDKKHNFDQPALGYVNVLKRVGDKLVATFVNIPKIVKEAIDKGLYKKRSAEVYWDLQVEGKKYPRVLKACALLGASVPAITNLADISKFFDVEDNESETRVYDLPVDAKGDGDGSWSEYAVTKTDDGVEYPKAAYLYVPDPEKSSTWKLRIWESMEKKITQAQLGRAAAALSAGGFRGNKAELPEGEEEKIKKKLRGLYLSLGIAKEEIPSHLFNYKDITREVTTMDYEALLKEKEDKIVELQEKLVKYQADKDAEKIVELTEAIETQQAEISQLKKFEEENKSLQEKVAEAEKALTESAAREKRRDVEIFLHQYGVKGEGKILPRDEKLVEEILMNCPEEKCFSVEGIKEKLSLVEMVKEYIMRQDKKVDTSQHSKQDKEGDAKQYVSVAQEVDAKTKEYMTEKGEKLYHVAMKIVLDTDPDLKKRYTGAKA